MAFRGERALRQGLLAVTVLDDVDLTPENDGVWLPGPTSLFVTWGEWTAALDGADPETPIGRERLAGHARARLRLAAGEPVQPRPYAVPVGQPRHPGPAWVRSTVPGGLLDLGIGIAGLHPAELDRIAPLPPTACAAHGADANAWFSTALDYLERMAGLAVARFARRPGDPLRPMGDCDVVTLLASRTFRAGLVSGAAGTMTGLRTAASPMRDRGWLDLRRNDPEFVACAAAATGPERRGFARPLLVTADGLGLPGVSSAYPPPAARLDRPRSAPRS